MCFNEALWVCPLLVARHDHVSKFGGCAVYLDCLLKRGVVLVAVYVEPCCDSGRAESGVFYVVNRSCILEACGWNVEQQESQCKQFHFRRRHITDAGHNWVLITALCDPKFGMSLISWGVGSVSLHTSRKRLA